MFDISNPQKRERLLVIVAVVVLFFIVLWQLPAQFREIQRLKRNRDDVVKKIDDHNRHAPNKELIHSRLAAFETQALAGAGSSVEDEAKFGYRTWLENLATGAGLSISRGSAPTSLRGPSGPHGYSKHTFTLNGEGRLDQIVEFLRRFYRTEYLHIIQTFQPRPHSNRPGIFTVSFKIEVLSLPQIQSVIMPNIEDIRANSEERQMLTAIQRRAILSEYTPPRPLTVGERTHESIIVSWTETDDADSYDIRYKIRSAPNEEENWTIIEGTTGVIRGLLANTEYEFQIRSVNEDGPADWSISVPAATGQPVVEFVDVAFCFLDSIVESDGRLQCWIDHRTAGRRYYLSEAQSFQLAGFRITIKNIDMENQQILVELDDNLWSLKTGQNFSEIEPE